MLGHIADDLRDTQERINWCLDRDEKGNVESGTRSPWNSAFDRMEQSGRNHDLDDEDGHGYTFVKENKEAAAARIADPIHSQTVGIVGTCQETFRESQGDFHKLPSAIEKAIAAAGANVRLQPVLFSEIHRACIIVDHNIYVWNYVQDEVRRHGGPASTDWFGGQKIVAVGLVLPRAGAFDHVAEEVDSVLVVTTPVSIFLCAVVFVGGGRRDPTSAMRVMMPSFVIPSDDVLFTVITGTTNGRIFVGGGGGYLHELIYEARGMCMLFNKHRPIVPNRAKRFRKTLAVSSDFGGTLRTIAFNSCPDFITGIFTGDPTHYQVLDVQVDHTRNRMYSLTATQNDTIAKLGGEAVPYACVIEAWDLGVDGKGTKRLHSLTTREIKLMVIKYIDLTSNRGRSRRKWLPEKAHIEAKEARDRNDMKLAELSFRTLIPLQVFESGRPKGKQQGRNAFNRGAAVKGGHPNLLAITRRGIRVYFLIEKGRAEVVYLRTPPVKLRHGQISRASADGTAPLHMPRHANVHDTLCVKRQTAGKGYESDLHRCLYSRGVLIGALGPRSDGGAGAGHGHHDALFCATTDHPIWTRKPKDHDRVGSKICRANVYGRWVRAGFRETMHTPVIKEPLAADGSAPRVVIYDIGEMPVAPMQESRLESLTYEKAVPRSGQSVRGGGSGMRLSGSGGAGAAAAAAGGKKRPRAGLGGGGAASPTEYRSHENRWLLLPELATQVFIYFHWIV